MKAKGQATAAQAGKVCKESTSRDYRFLAPTFFGKSASSAGGAGWIDRMISRLEHRNVSFGYGGQGAESAIMLGVGRRRIRKIRQGRMGEGYHRGGMPLGADTVLILN